MFALANVIELHIVYHQILFPLLNIYPLVTFVVNRHDGENNLLTVYNV